MKAVELSIRSRNDGQTRAGLAADWPDSSLSRASPVKHPASPDASVEDDNRVSGSVANGTCDPDRSPAFSSRLPCPPMIRFCAAAASGSP